MVRPTWPVTSRAELGACYDATFDEVFRYAAHLTGDRGRAEDLVSDAYVDLVRVSREGGVASVGVGWLITVVRRRFIDGLRADDREHRRLRLVRAGGDESASPVAVDRSRELLTSLSERERAAVVLRYVEDLPVAEVASELSISVRATESLLARARARLRRSEVRDA